MSESLARLVSTHRTEACDESGLCDEVAALANGGASTRLIDRWGSALIVADIAPIVVGHVLVVASEHVPRVSRLSASARDDLDLAVSVADYKLRKRLGSDTVIVEHGSGDVSAPGDCVRHCHVHVMPVARRSTRDVADLLQNVLEKVSVTRRDQPLPVSSNGYVSVDCGGVRCLGQPKSGARHVARVILALLAGKELSHADWGLWVHNPAFAETIRRLGRF